MWFVMMTGSWHCPFSALNVKVIPRVKQWVAISEATQGKIFDGMDSGDYRPKSIVSVGALHFARL